jgi:hypothetical protein
MAYDPRSGYPARMMLLLGLTREETEGPAGQASEFASEPRRFLDISAFYRYFTSLRRNNRTPLRFQCVPTGGAQRPRDNHMRQSRDLKQFQEKQVAVLRPGLRRDRDLEQLVDFVNAEPGAAASKDEERQ